MAAVSAMLIKYLWIPFKNGKHGTYLMVDWRSQLEHAEAALTRVKCPLRNKKPFIHFLHLEMFSPSPVPSCPHSRRSRVCRDSPPAAADTEQDVRVNNDLIKLSERFIMSFSSPARRRWTGQTFPFPWGRWWQSCPSPLGSKADSALLKWNWISDSEVRDQEMISQVERRAHIDALACVCLSKFLVLFCKKIVSLFLKKCIHYFRSFIS